MVFDLYARIVTVALVAFGLRRFYSLGILICVQQAGEPNIIFVLTPAGTAELLRLYSRNIDGCRRTHNIYVYIYILYMLHVRKTIFADMKTLL